MYLRAGGASHVTLTKVFPDCRACGRMVEGNDGDKTTCALCLQSWHGNCMARLLLLSSDRLAGGSGSRTLPAPFFAASLCGLCALWAAPAVDADEASGQRAARNGRCFCVHGRNGACLMVSNDERQSVPCLLQHLIPPRAHSMSASRHHFACTVLCRHGCGVRAHAHKHTAACREAAWRRASWLQPASGSGSRPAAFAAGD
jgi:hypothetical protein